VLEAIAAIATCGDAAEGLEAIMATSAAGAVELDREALLGMYEKMMQIRTFEDLAGKNFAAGLVPGFVHLYAGEEAVAVGICSHLTDNDFITSTHRGHGHCIAKGVDIAGMVAELMGKSSGVCKGKGGSMHIADIEKGMLAPMGLLEVASRWPAARRSRQRLSAPAAWRSASSVTAPPTRAHSTKD
jgi:TPP-dependent pyruvate/acetoin dehydrogenase alpha subunit